MLLWVAHLALLGAAMSAVILARRRADHWPIAIFFAWFMGVTVTRGALDAGFGLLRPVESPPFTGAARIAFHLDQGMELSWAAGLAAVAILAFSRQRWPVALVALLWAGAVAYLATHYPEIRGDVLRQVYLAAELAALAVATGVMITWTWRRESPTPVRVCALCLYVGDAVTLFAGAWHWGFWVHWDLQQAGFALLYATLAVFQVIMWKFLPSGSSRR